MSDEEAIFDEAMDNLRQAAQRIRATRNRLWSAGMDDHPNYRDLIHRISSAPAMTEAAFVEARRRSESGQGHNQEVFADAPPPLKFLSAAAGA
jgi:hypothetical protein